MAFELHATSGASHYRNKNRNEILTDSVQLLYNENGLFILCDTKTKEIIISRKNQKKTRNCDIYMVPRANSPLEFKLLETIENNLDKILEI